MREHLFSHKWLVAFIPVTNSDWQIHKHSQTHNFPKLICWLICAYHQNACDSSRCSWESEYVMERNKGCRGLLGEHTANSYCRRDTDNDAWQWGSIKRKKKQLSCKTWPTVCCENQMYPCSNWNSAQRGREETWRMTRKEEARKSQREFSYICKDWSSIFVFILPEIICKACVWESLIQMGKSFFHL